MTPPTPSSPAVSPDETPQDNTPRTKKACDLCRNRKVKCRVLDHQVDCQGCRELGLSCTRNKPRRRRGPLNRHALAQLQSTSPNEGACSTSPQVPPPPPQARVSQHELATVNTKHPGRSVNSLLELLAPIPLIKRILIDWFKYVHPLAPVLHRQHLLHRMHVHGEDADPVFAALILSVCSVTVATLRRKSFEAYPAITVERCVAIIEEERLLAPQPYSLDWCISWYHVASALLVDHGPEEFRVYRAIKEAMTSVTYLLCFKGGDGYPEPAKEMMKRLYWFLFMWQKRGAELRGQPHLTHLPFNQDLDHLRPRVVLDRDLYPCSTHGDDEWPPSWPEDEIHYIPGLNSLIDMFLIWEKAKVDMAHRPPQDVLSRAMERIQTALDGLRPELRWRGGLTRFPRGSWGHEVQMVNILITALSIKSNFLQHLGSLLPGITHQDIVSDVLEILNHLPQPVFEANGCAVVHKIRDIGSAYLAELRIGSGVVVGDDEAQQKVYQLLNKLDSLDFRPLLDTGEVAADT